MGSFFKKIANIILGAKGQIEPPPPMPKIPPAPWAEKCRQFQRFTFHSEIAKLFLIDPVPRGALPIYDLDGGEKEIITIEDGKPRYLKTDITQLHLQLQENITEQDLMNCLFLAAKLAQPTDYVGAYATSGGWASVSGNKLENRLYNNIYVKDFPKTLLFPEPEYAGLICECSPDGINIGYGFFMLLEKVRVVRDS